MSVHKHPMDWAREMETLLSNGTINKDNYLTDCANAVVYVRESADKITQLQAQVEARDMMITELKNKLTSIVNLIKNAK